MNYRRYRLLTLALLLSACDRQLTTASESASLSLVPREEARVTLAEAMPISLQAIGDVAGTAHTAPIYVPAGKHLLDVRLQGQITIHPNTDHPYWTWMNGVTFGPGGLAPPAGFVYSNFMATWVYFKPEDTPETTGTWRLLYVSPRDARGTTRPLSFTYYVEGPGEIVVYRYASFLLPSTTTVTGGHTVTVHATPLEEGGELDLECTPQTVERGQPVQCTASVQSDDADLEWNVTDWTFESPDGVTISPGDPAQRSSRTWRGPMVRSGTVTVTANVGGEPRTKSASISVTDRTWSDRSPEYTFRKIASGQDARMVLPRSVRWSEDLGFASWFRTETPSSESPDYTDEVLEGPNEGLKYFGQETSIDFFGYYVLNTEAMTRGSAFYDAQEERRSGGTRLGGLNVCDADVVTRALPDLVERHEVYHGEVYERVLRANFQAALAELERKTDPDYGALYDACDGAWSRLDSAARGASMAIHGERGNPGRVTPRDSDGDCALKNEFSEVLTHEPATSTSGN